MSDIEYLHMLDVQRWSTPPVTMRQTVLAMRVTDGRLTGLGIGECEAQAEAQMFSGRMVEA